MPDGDAIFSGAGGLDGAAVVSLAAISGFAAGGGFVPAFVLNEQAGASFAISGGFAAVASRGDTAAFVGAGAFTIDTRFDYASNPAGIAAQGGLIANSDVGRISRTQIPFDSGAVDLQLLAGDDCELDVSLFDMGGGALNLTGASAQWFLADAYDRSRILITKTSAYGGGITIASPTMGTMVIAIAPADTAALGGQPYYHELKIILGWRNTTLSGSATIEKTTAH
jgi:hypothetical protein